MQNRLSYFRALLAVLGTFTTLMLVQPSLAQIAPTQAQAPSGVHARPIPIEHIYWYFLLHQNHLDTLAANLDAHGKDGSEFRNGTQKQLGFSDDAFAAVRTAANRLAAEANALHAQAVAQQKSAAPSGHLALGLQRDAAISGAITYLKQSLTHDQVIALESYMIGLYHQPTAGPLAPTGVQQ